MEQILSIFTVRIVSGVLLAMILFPFWRWVSLRIGVFDDPGQRKIHCSRMPLAGGVTVFFTGVILWLSWSMVGEIPPSREEWLWMMGGGIFFLIGLADDLREMAPGLKLILQLGAAAWTVWNFHFNFLSGETVPEMIVSLGVTFCWFMIVLNSLNFLDNMNGLCCGLGIILGSAFYLQGSFEEAALTSIMSEAAFFIGGLIGFLPFNYPRARAFLGDSGSHLVGYCVGVGSIEWGNILLKGGVSGGEGSVEAVNWLCGGIGLILMMGVPLYDLLTTMWIRFQAGKPLYIGDTNHISHRLVRRGWSRAAAVGLIWGAAVLTCMGGLFWFYFCRDKG